MLGSLGAALFSPFKSSALGSQEIDVRDEIYDSDERLRRYRRIIAGFGANISGASPPKPLEGSWA